MKILLISYEDESRTGIRLIPFPQEPRPGLRAPLALPGVVNGALRALQAEAPLSRGKKLPGSERDWPKAPTPAGGLARPRYATLVNLPKQIWKKALAPHARTARAFRL